MRIIKPLLGLTVLTGCLATAFLTRGAWLPLLNSAPPSAAAEEQSHPPAAAPSEQVKLSPQAQQNLRLTAKPLTPEIWWRTLPLPGTVVDRPGRSDQGIVAPVTGVVTHIHHFPGDTVSADQSLFTIRLLSETLHLTQSELFKTNKEMQMNQEQRKRLSSAASIGAVPEAKLIEIDNQLSRLNTAAQSYRQELLTRGLTPRQIDSITEGKYVSEIEVKSPASSQESRLLSSSNVRQTSAEVDDGHGQVSFEIQELKVELGQQVQAGQTLCLLSNHQSLYVEGRAFRQETPLIERAAKEGWPVEIEFMEEQETGWPALQQSFVIRSIANTIDPTSRTFAFFLPLDNQSRMFSQSDRTQMLWRFRPGQRVLLHVKVEKMENVFVLPNSAVAHEGPEAYIFPQNGNLFQRKPVHVLFEDRQQTVVANDDSVRAGAYVAQNGAMQLNRAIKAQSGGASPGFHVHADGTVHANH